MKRLSAIRPAGLVLASVGVFLSAPTAALAQRRPTPQRPPAEDPAVAEARRSYDEGRTLFEGRSFTEALRRFERAYALRPNPVILVAIANCHEQTNNPRDAIAALERYLRDRPDAPDRATVEARMVGLRARAAQSSAATGTAAATGPVGGATSAAGTTGTSAAGTTGTDAAGTTGTSAAGTTGTSAAGTTGTGGATEPDASATNVGAAGADGAASAESTSDAGASAEAIPPTRATSPAVWVCAALAGAGVAGGSVLGFLALGEHATYNTMPSRAVKDRGETYALLADLSFATAVLSGFVGTVVFLSDRAESEREQRATQALSPLQRSRYFSRTRVRPSPLGVTIHW